MKEILTIFFTPTKNMALKNLILSSSSIREEIINLIKEEDNKTFNILMKKEGSNNLYIKYMADMDILTTTNLKKTEIKFINKYFYIKYLENKIQQDKKQSNTINAVQMNLLV